MTNKQKKNPSRYNLPVLRISFVYVVILIYGHRSYGTHEGDTKKHSDISYLLTSL